MSEKSTVTTRSKLRRLEEDVRRKRALEADSGVPSDRPPGSPSIATTLYPEQAQVIPLTGPGRIVDHRDMSTPVRSVTRRARPGTSVTSSRSGQKSADYLRRRAEYEAEKELVRMKEKLVQKKLEADLAEIDAAAEEDSCSEAEDTTACRVEEWVTHTTPVVTIEQVPTCRDVPPPQPQVQVSELLSDVFQRPSASVSVSVPPPAPPVQFERAPAPANSAPAPFPQRESAHPATLTVNAGTAHATNRGLPEWDTGAEEIDKSRSTRDRKIDQLAEAIASIARPRPVPRQAYELPTFKGDPAEWLSYKNMYFDTTTLYEFKPHENLARLKTSLQGEARIAVEDLLRASASPSEIIKTLDEEYGHPNLILECVLKKIRVLPRVTESGRELRKFSTTIRNCVSLLKSVRANGYLNNPQLVSELLNKLTPVQRAQYGDFAMGMASSQGLDMRVSPSIEILSEFLNHLARASSFYVQPDMPVSALSKPRAGAPPVKIIKNAQRLHVHANEVENAQTPTAEESCQLCKEKHKLATCKQFNDLDVNERWTMVKEQKLCFNCLGDRHSKKICRKKRCATCHYAHHDLLHITRKPESVTNVSVYNGKALLKIIPVHVISEGKEEKCYALLDDGATVSLIDGALAGNAQGKHVPLTIKSARGQQITDQSSRVISVGVRGPNGQVHKIKCRTLVNMDLPSQSVPAAVMSEHAHLRDLGCEVMCSAKPLLLLGQDNWELLVGREMRRGKSGKPVASLTSLGWVVHGPLGSVNYNNQTVNCIGETSADLHNLVKRQFELEAIGISEIPRKHVDIERANHILDTTSRQSNGGAWEVGLLWRQDNPQLPDNYINAKQRLSGILRRFKKDTAYEKAYKTQIERLIKEGYASKVQGEINYEPVWYLPHFGVTNPNKPGKLRLVFDAAAKHEGTSLNEHLLTGPDLLNPLIGVLFKFRCGPVAFTADIADMFLRVRIREQDRGAQLFLWAADSDKEPEVYKMNSMIFGAVSSPTSAIYILNKNANKYIDSHPNAVSAVRSNHYMDDYLDSAWSVEQAGRLIEDVTHIHAEGGFVIRGWVTNSPELRDRLSTEMPDKVSLDKGEDGVERTLGLTWSPATDKMAFDLSFKRLPKEITEGRVVPTKREFLRFIMSIFDPLGFLYPCVIQSRILMKKIWNTGIGWDEQLKKLRRAAGSTGLTICNTSRMYRCLGGTGCVQTT